MKRLLIGIIAALTILAIMTPCFRNGPIYAASDRTIWSGVFTDAQAARGEAVYQTNCRRCHGDVLEGSRSNPSLKGEKFIDNWREDTLESLFRKINKTMPRNDPGILSERDSLDVTAFVLKSNSSPAGSNELTASVLASIQVEGKDGPKPLPNRAMAQVTGCLTHQDDDDTWMLTQAATPIRTRNPDAITPEEIKASQNVSAGALSFRLQNFEILGAFSPESHTGHKMLAKGVLLAQPSGNRISLTSMEMVSPTCGK